jgi:hypothetical protein
VCVWGGGVTNSFVISGTFSIFEIIFYRGPSLCVGL